MTNLMDLHYVKAELTIPLPVQRGATGPHVKRIQEWLGFHGCGVAVDGEFGPATEAAVKAWRKHRKILPPADGIVTTLDWTEMTAPMCRAVDTGNQDAVSVATLNHVMYTFALRHASEHPVEIGGDNRGPWVRLYMRGLEGKQYPWCAGFTSFVLQQACAAKGWELDRMPVPYLLGCDSIADSAKRRGLFVRGQDLRASGKLPVPGWLFLVPNKARPGLYQHIGIVGYGVRPGVEVMPTIEGNTNDTGSPEGYAVCQRTRAWADKDFVRIDG